jgi:hypothetical protein
MSEFNDVFRYHAPKGNQPKRYEELREKAREMATRIRRLCPPSNDRDAAILKLRECIMLANASIAIGESDSGHSGVIGADGQDCYGE